MSALVWKLLRQHISIGQLAGFFLANLFGMMIVLLSVQFYKDIIPVFTEGDSFMKKDFIIATKKISTLGSFAGKNNTFSAEDIADLKKQSFTKTIGAFTPPNSKFRRDWVCRKLVFIFPPICFSNRFPMNLLILNSINGTLMKPHTPFLSLFPAIT